MNIDKFLESQTFKTGTFVLLVLFVFVIVFKLGVLHGYKKARFSSHGYGTGFHRNIDNSIFGYKKSSANKEMFAKFILKKQLLKDMTISDSIVEDESDNTVDSVE